MKEVEVNLKGPGAGRESAVRGLQSAGLTITAIRDTTPVPHNGCRARKRDVYKINCERGSFFAEILTQIALSIANDRSRQDSTDFNYYFIGAASCQLNMANLKCLKGSLLIKIRLNPILLAILQSHLKEDLDIQSAILCDDDAFFA